MWKVQFSPQDFCNGCTVSLRAWPLSITYKNLGENTAPMGDTHVL